MINENTGGKIHFPDGNLVTGARKSSRVLVWESMTNNKIENFGNDLFSKIDSPRAVMRSITMFKLTFGINTSEAYYSLTAYLIIIDRLPHYYRQFTSFLDQREALCQAIAFPSADCSMMEGRNSSDLETFSSFKTHFKLMLVLRTSWKTISSRGT